MHGNLAKCVFVSILMTIVHSAQAQSIITQWNFNSVPPDGSNSTGSLSPSVGAGVIAGIGGVTISFASGTATGGSSDSATSDNTGLGLTGWPEQGTNNKTAGIECKISTAGHQDITVTFDLRHSNTGPRTSQLQYTTDISAPNPVWTDFAADAATGGDAWFPRSYNLKAVSALNNNPNAGFRVVAAFEPLTAGYAPSNSGSIYATTGTWRFDMVTITGTASGGDVNPPVAQSFQVSSSTHSFIKFNETVTTSTAINIANYLFNPAININTATLSSSNDTVFLTHDPLINGQPYSISVSGVQDIAMNTMAPTTFNIVFNGSIPNLVITEIIHSPNDIEMIEVYNAGAGAINLGGLKWTNGTTGNFPEVSLAAGATAVFATSPATASATLNVSPVYPILNGLGSSDDILVIRNSLNQVVDSVSYLVGTGGWPTAPTGVYGYSFELINASADNNAGTNWLVPQNQVTPAPPQGIIRATPGRYPTPVYAPAFASVSFTSTRLSVNEATTTVNIIANLQGGGSSPSSIDIEFLPLATATGGSDYIVPASLQFNWAANASNVNDTIAITINNDALPENAEYFVVRFTNPVDIVMPAPAANHFTVMITDDDRQAPAASAFLQLNHIASFSNGAAGTNSAEIVAHDPASQRLFIANSVGSRIDIINFSNPAAATLITSVPVASYGNINSVAVKNGIVAAAIENATAELPGKVVFFDINGAFISEVQVGAMPDMILFNHAGTMVFTANEGQPNAAYTVDPEGSVSIIDISGGVSSITQAAVSTAGFGAYNNQAAALKLSGVRIFGLNNPTVAQDMEPEYITLSDDGQTAWVTCQENNAIAVIHTATATVTDIRPLGTKNHHAGTNGLDASDQGGIIEIAAWPVKGLYMPDAVASYSAGGQTYLVTANEGDAREYSPYEEALRLSSSSYVLDPAAFPYPEALKANIGRLNVSRASGDTDGDGDYDEIHAFGARSISIWNASTGALVWDSGDDMELITSKHPVFGAIFNASNANNTLKNRSDDKGPEPEGVAVAQISGRTFAFVALERIGGCMVYDITNPASPVFVDYKNTRTIAAYGGDNGAEGIIYISAENSPTGSPVVILANEVSSTLSFYAVNVSVLDISLISIKAKNNGNRNQVTWTTATEVSGDVFEIERSRNGTTFSHQATVPARGLPSVYTYSDEQPFPGTTFYRLKLKHVSGKITYSSIVTADTKEMDAIVKVYPNPVTDKLTIVRPGGIEWTNVNIEIIDFKGVVVKRLALTPQQSTVDFSRMPSGVYTIRCFTKSQAISFKITKH